MKNGIVFENNKNRTSLYIKYFVLSVVLTMMSLYTLMGQNFCNTTGGINSPGVLPQGSGLQPGPFTLKVYMHIIRRSNSSGGITLGQLEESKSYLDNAFAPHSIFFAYACDVIYIDSDLYYANPSVHLCGLISQSSHTDGLDVYIGGDDSGVGGSAGSVLSYAFAIGGTLNGNIYSRSHVISHEMGHCFGLWHTHHGTTLEVGNDCNGNILMDPNECPECVDDGIHTNGDICGDYVLDTPADNNVNGRVDPNGCNFLGNDVDPCTNLNYTPSPVNIMSYTIPGCMKEFTPKQGKRMKSLIVLDQGLSSRLLQPGSNTITHVYSDAQIDISQTMPGDILVHTGAQLTILDCTIKMPWKSKIIVERGAVLLTINAILTKECGAPDWQGIHVEGNSALEQPEVYDVPTFDQAGIVIIANNSTVEWARTAISTSRPDGYYGDYFGGLIYATNSQFLYNRRVAEFMKYDKVNKSVFDNCVLDGKNRFNTVGVTIWDCDNILFTFNDIQNMKIGGIYTIDGSAVVRNANNFSNCGDGIYSMATYPASGIMVVEGIGSNRNIFNNNLRHIRVNNNGPYNDLLIKNNDFNIAPGRGIEIIGPSFFRIEENNFASHQTGIYVADCGAMNGFNLNWVWMNNFTNSLYGINAVSENR